MNEMAYKYAGMERFAGRKAGCRFEKGWCWIISNSTCIRLDIRKEPVSAREPYLSKQWFVRMEPLAEEVLKHQETRGTENSLYPQYFEKTFHQWLEKYRGPVYLPVIVVGTPHSCLVS